MTRLARPELYWTVNSLAREVTKWNVACDKRLHRLINYIHHNKDVEMVNFIGDNPADCKLFLFVDASFAGDLKDSKSTSGSILCLVGPRTFCVLTWLCKKQTAVSHSSTESEIIALDMGLRVDGIPILDLWDVIIDVLDPIVNETVIKKPERSILDTEHQILMNVDYMPSNVPETSKRGKLLLLEDNDAVIKMCIKGRSPNMRHMMRVHRVDTDWLFERILSDPGIAIKYVNTKLQLADIFTKGSFTEQTWKTLCKLLQIGPVYFRL